MSGVTPYFGEPAAAPREAAPRESIPSRTFAEILSDRALSPPSPVGRAHGFDELGMFGLHGAQPFGAVRSKSGQVGEQAALPRQGYTAHPHTHTSPTRNVPAAQDAKTAPRPPMATPPILAPRKPTAAVSSPIAVAANPAGRTMAAGEGDVSAPTRTGASMNSLPPPPAQKAQSAITAHGEDDALAVVARAALSDRESADLRRRLSGVAAEFGMQIGDLVLNGSTAPHHAIQGGPHGSRSR